MEGHCKDTEALEQVCSLNIQRVQSSRLRGEGLPEEDELRVGIEAKIESERSQRRVIGFSPGDPEDPRNWSNWRKWGITAAGIIAVSNSTFASSLPSGSLPYIKADFHIQHDEIAILAISLFLMGYVIGPIAFAPMSEYFGRRGVTLVAFGWFVIGSICCAVSPNIAALLVFRFLAGVGASAPMSVTGGTFADVWHEPQSRGRIMAIFSAVTMIGPTLAPIVGGFVSASRLGWRMVFWIQVIVASLSFIPLYFCPETFAPIILLRKAARLRKQGETDVIAPLELEDRSLKTSLKTTLSRPFRMFWYEGIVLLVSLFLGFVYAVFYIFFQSYPLIYSGIYNFGPGISGLPFIPIGLGAGFSYFFVLAWDRHLQGKDQRGEAFSSEYRRLPLACIGGPLCVAGIFWQAWSARADVHWMVSIMSGLPFGCGFALLFISFLNYLTDFYEIYAASALAACSMCRSLLGAAFPLFSKRMYQGLGIDWGDSLLGFFALAMSVCPFIFIHYGDAIRKRSKFYQFLQERRQMFDEHTTDGDSYEKDDTDEKDDDGEPQQKETN